MKILTYVGGALLFAAFAFVFLTGAVKATLVSGESMFPTYHSGDVVVVAKNTDYKVGDVIVYHPESLHCDKCNVVHRIVGGDKTEGWITQGDNNENVDGWRPKAAEILGTVNFHLPVGAFTPILLSPKFGMMLVAISMLTGVIGLLRNQFKTEDAEKVEGNETTAPSEATSSNATV